MRAGPLSNETVASLLNRYFVPVYISNEDYREDGLAPPAEKAEHNRIYRDSLQQGLSTGTVHVYVIAPDGRPIDSLHVADAAKTLQLIAMLERTIDGLKPAEGLPLVEPKSQAARPVAEAGDLVLHLSSRVIKPCAWGEFPAENWIVLEQEQAAELLPPPEAQAGGTWEIAAEVSSQLLQHFYPATENNDLSKNRILEQSLRGTVVERTTDRVRARLDGRLRMEHDFYHRPDDRVVEATLVGYLDSNPKTRQILTYRLVTQTATYGPGTFGIALRSVAPGDE